MATAREQLVALIDQPESDASLWSTRQSVLRSKREAIAHAAGLNEAGIRLVMPELYAKIVRLETDLANKVGLRLAVAVTAYDEHVSGASLSRFSREIREGMREMAVEQLRTQETALGKLVARVEAERLVLRHTHELLSWLAFRRHDPANTASDRLARIEAFKVLPTLSKTRVGLSEMLGERLAAAIEAHDRFHLTNRWKLDASPEGCLESRVWTMLSARPDADLQVDLARLEHDELSLTKADAEPMGRAFTAISTALRQQLIESL